MLKLKNYLRPYLPYILFTFCIKFCATFVELQIPNLMETLLDEKVPSGNVDQIYLYGGLMILCALVALGGNIWANRMASLSSGRITRTLRYDLFRKLNTLSARQMDDLSTSSAVSRLTSDSYNVNLLLNRLQRIGVRAPLMLMGSLIFMLRMDAKLALVLIILLPPICIVAYFVTRYTIHLYTKVQSVQDDLVRVCQENITGIRVIKALSKTEYEKGRFDGVNEDHSSLNQRAGTINNITRPVTSLILNLGLTLVVVFGAFQVNAGELKSGVIVAFLQYFTMIINATLIITRIFIMWSKGEASANRIADVLALPEDLQVLPEQGVEENAPHIEFRNVSFSYTGVGKNLENLSFSLEKGQTLGILGPTGSGKSTIINLLLRLYDVDSGSVLINGRDIRTIPNEELRSMIGIVFQNDFITEGTIDHNIRFFRGLGDVQTAANHAQADFIKEKEGGMDAPVAIRGNNLSGGQKQRILIARALAGNPEILVLDDASSALDYQTDSNLRKALRTHYRNTTTVLIAQRVSSLRHADLILVLDDGKVIGAGKHDHLMAVCEEYRIIADAQMGDGQEVV